MLRDRYEPMNVFTLVPTLRLALAPVLTQRDRVLDDNPLFQAVKADLARRCPRTRTDGRPSTPVEVILRLRVVKHLSGWSAEATERWVSDRLVLRQCCRVSVAPVPDETTRLRWANLLQPATLHRRLDQVVALARTLQVTRGRKLRIDGTVGETPIHHPTDSPLLYDGVRVRGRPLANVRALLPQTAGVTRDAVRDRPRSAKRQRKRIMDAARPRGPEAADRMHPAYQRLLDSTQATVPHARPVGAVLMAQGLAQGQQLAATLAHMAPVVGQGIAQTTRRVLQGEVVPATAKGVSLFEPHTAISRPGTPGKPTEFGRVLWLDEVDGGLISRDTLLEGNPAEEAQLPPSLDHPRRIFTRPPRLRTGDRGMHSTANAR